MFKYLFGGAKARHKWEKELLWFRLRYEEARQATRCIRLLSRPEACGRVALYYQPGAVISELYLGLPEQHSRLLQQMAGDLGLGLWPKLPEVALPASQPLEAVCELPWEEAFMAHVVNEFVFVTRLEAGQARGAYLPQPPAQPGDSPDSWQLPAPPPPGLALGPVWPTPDPPAHLVAHAPDPGHWLLGRSSQGHPLHVPGQINLYGHPEAVAAWLVHQVTQMIRVDHRNLVVIDGAGDLVPRLKRKEAVTRLLGEQLTYIDVDNASRSNGFNPLAAAPGESEADLLQRWQRWFAGMNVHPQSLERLAEARRAGVGDIAALRKWLQQSERQGQQTTVATLTLALSRLTASRQLRECLEWPSNRFTVLPHGALLVACRNSSWEKQQLLGAILLGVLPVAGARLVIHGFPWKGFDRHDLGREKCVNISNGPLLPDSTVILTASQGQSLTALAARFLEGDVGEQENLALLREGEAMVLTGERNFFTTWRGRAVGDMSNRNE